MNGKSHWSACFKFVALASLVPVILLAMSSAASAQSDDEAQIEHTLRQGLDALAEGNQQQSLQHIGALLTERADFRLGRLVYADLLAAQAHQNTLMAHSEALDKVRIRGLVEEAQARVHYRRPPSGYYPDVILQLSPLYDYALVLDADQSRLYVLKNRQGAPELVRDYYISTGNGGLGKADEGDEKTPLGVYHLSAYLEDDTLPELYGVGAYPINYPNRWDQLKRRSGSGIWLHGTPRTVYSRPPQDSRGCVVLSNPLITALSSYIDIGHTPIVLAQRVKWMPPDSWQANRAPLLAAIRRWQQDWQSLDVEKYLAHYSPDYRTAKHSYSQMLKTSRRNARKKTFIEVGIQDLDIFAYPGEADTVIASFDQDYRSNNYTLRYRKQQWWRYAGGRWRIVFEDRAETATN